MLIQSNIVLSLNFLFSPILLLILVLSNNLDLASYFGLTSAFIIFITQSLSANKRQIIILSNDFFTLKKTFIERIIISIIILLICSLYFFIFDFNNNSLILFIFCSFICIFWIQEILLTELEQKKNRKIILYELILYSFFYLSVLYYFFLGDKKFIFLIILYIFILIFSLIFIRKLFLFQKILKLNLIKKNFFLDIIYFSSFSLILCNFLWRLMIFYFCGDLKAGMIYAAFSLGSFPSTLFVNIFGTNLVKAKNNKNKILSFFSLYVFFVIIILYLINFNLLQDYFQFHSFFLIALKYSIFGSIFMLCGQYLRKIIIMKNIKTQNKRVFTHDIIYSVLLFFVVPLSYYFGKEDLLIKSFLIGSIICFIYYLILIASEKLNDKI